MKTKLTLMSALSLGIVLSLSSANRAMSNENTDRSEADSLSSMKGTTTAVDLSDRTMTVRGFWGSRVFHLAPGCGVNMDTKADASTSDLRPGQKVLVQYDEVNGVRIAHEIKERTLRFSGQIIDQDPSRHTFSIHTPTLDKKFRYQDDCDVVLMENRAGKFADLQPGNYVTVIYEVPDGHATARQIIRTGATFEGSLTAIDLGDRTLKAHAPFRTKSFAIGENCKIMVDGKPDARLSDLKLGEKLVFNYQDVKGVNVVNNIRTAGEGSATASSREDHSADVSLRTAD